ncbi:TraM recognition domain-containing protein [Curtobacterium sp. MCBD17_003]|uniref:type IV secretory system conjugative DNA transfer family protein n=1 Tax=Curtobacterium sp. MCBD17_003 TaxID=2175667 RepID=UPI000DA7135F|nr:TraM recognition domain-containing protein [Curtobacterium sp. MCBD17_003]WIE56323.1 TraM recognition domain-containing protein [Curtobacterium sp. MCBD17_003]
MNGSNIRTNTLTVTLLVLIVGGVFLGIHAGAGVAGTGDAYSWNPIVMLMGFVKGDPWPGVAATVFVVVFVLAALALFTWMLMAQAKRGAKKRGAASIKLMSANPSNAVVRESARSKDARRLHPTAAGIGPGQKVGRIVGTSKWVYQGWEETGVYLYGTRRGKTTSVVVRHVVEAPGAAIMTSNKVDGVREAIRGRRGRGETFVFDPNRIYRHEDGPDFVFNPLEYVKSAEDARELAEIFEASTRKENDRGGDPQFDEPGRDMLAYFLLAAALDGLPLSRVYRWLTTQDSDAVIGILNQHGKKGPATALVGIENWADKTRQSVYATAQRMAGALAYDELLEWTSKPGVRRFDVDAFVQSEDLLILLSKDGVGSAGAILTSLVRAICKTGERLAQRSGGRLPVPLVIELDECANIVRWPALPSVYSFYGSLGMPLNTYFQSRDQAVEAFGQNGWGAIWGAAVTRVFGGGAMDDQFLKGLSSLIGDREEVTYGGSTQDTGAYSTSTSTRRVPILDVHDLANLPLWRAVMFNSNTRPVILDAVPWFKDKKLRPLIEGDAPATAGAAPAAIATSSEEAAARG